jgi:hypothetical protein
MEQQPYVTVLVDGHQVATVQLGLSLVFEVTALLAGISAGRLAAVHTGRCDVTAALAIQGAELVTREAHFELPGQGARLHRLRGPSDGQPLDASLEVRPQVGRLARVSERRRAGDHLAEQRAQLGAGQV